MNSRIMDGLATDYLNGMYESQYDESDNAMPQDRACEVCGTRFIGRDCPFEGDTKHQEYNAKIPF